MRHDTIWILVANGNATRLFDLPGRNAEPVPLEGQVWTAPEINDFADSQGMSHASTGASQRRMSPRTEPGDRALAAFARDINDRLTEALNKGAFDQLIVVAAPRLLGHLREQLNTAVKDSIRMEIDKDFAHLPLDKLGQALAPHLFP